MKDHSEMSDAELSAEVLKIKYGEIGVIALYETGAKLITNEVTHNFDINNPSDMWPLIVENGICIHVDNIGENSYANTFDSNGYCKKEFYDKKPLRAAAIVFLMLNEG